MDRGEDFEGKVALVLGAVKGIGKGVAEDLAEAGARVALTYFDWEEEAEALRRDFSRFGQRSLIRKTDLREAGEVRELIEAVGKRFGRLDILINNIERGGWPVVHGPYTVEQWDLEMETTLRAKRWVFEASLPLLKASGDGCVVNFSSIAGLVGRAGPAGLVFNDGYAAANRGISLLTETWARMGAPEVRVNELMLGFFETRHAEGTRGWDLLGETEKKGILAHTLLGRTGRIRDIVKAVRFLVRDARFMTGSVIRMDGGYLLGGESVPPMPGGVL